jgi:hypothetical protein
MCPKCIAKEAGKEAPATAVGVPVKPHAHETDKKEKKVAEKKTAAEASEQGEEEVESKDESKASDEDEDEDEDEEGEESEEGEDEVGEEEEESGEGEQSGDEGEGSGVDASEVSGESEQSEQGEESESASESATVSEEDSDVAVIGEQVTKKPRVESVAAPSSTASLSSASASSAVPASQRAGALPSSAPAVPSAHVSRASAENTIVIEDSDVEGDIQVRCALMWSRPQVSLVSVILREEREDDGKKRVHAYPFVHVKSWVVFLCVVRARIRLSPRRRRRRDDSDDSSACWINSHVDHHMQRSARARAHTHTHTHTPAFAFACIRHVVEHFFLRQILGDVLSLHHRVSCPS